MGLVVGADSCPGGWVLALVEDRRDPRLRFVPSFNHAVDEFRAASVFAVDIPIGLPADDARPADDEARRFIGPRGSSVFPAPPAAVFGATSYVLDAIVAAWSGARILRNEARRFPVDSTSRAPTIWY